VLGYLKGLPTHYWMGEKVEKSLSGCGGEELAVSISLRLMAFQPNRNMAMRNINTCGDEIDTWSNRQVCSMRILMG